LEQLHFSIIRRKKPKTMIEIFAGLYPLKNNKDYKELLALAEQEKHAVLVPTHVVKKGSEIVGHVSVGGIPLTFCHFSKNMDAGDSFSIINTVENMLQLGGHTGVVTPVAKDSPFYRVLSNPKVGYRFLASVDLFHKEF